jgi:hypothetical protein
MTRAQCIVNVIGYLVFAVVVVVSFTGIVLWIYDTNRDCLGIIVMLIIWVVVSKIIKNNRTEA